MEPRALSFLNLKGVSRSFGSFTAVKNLDLEVFEGEYITLLGPSGCGKTTTLRMIAGFMLPSAGQIFLDGVDIANIPPEKRPVNTVFQDYALFPHLTVFQNVEYGLKVRRISREDRSRRVKEMLGLVQMNNLADRYPRYLSGGQQQRVALARALVCQPRLLLLDEPLGALDAKLREQMQVVLKGLQRALKIAFIHVTHDQMEAMALSDRIVVMQAGAIMQTGTPQDLYHRPANSFVADFIGSTNLFEAQVLSKDGELVRAEVDGCIFSGFTSRQLLPGQRIFLSMRPSDLRVSKPASNEGMENQINATVDSIVYRGEQLLVRGKAGELSLAALIAEADFTKAGIRMREHLTFTWDSDKVWIMET